MRLEGKEPPKALINYFMAFESCKMLIVCNSGLSFKT